MSRALRHAFLVSALFLSAGALPAQAPTEPALVIPFSVLLSRLDSEVRYKAMFVRPDEELARAYFQGRADVYHELLALFGTLLPPPSEIK